MTTIPVNGTSIDAAIAGAQLDDVVDVKGSVGYAGFTVNKRVKVVAPDGALVQRTTAGDIIRVTAAGAELSGFEALGAIGPTSAAVAVINAPDVKLDHVRAGDAIYGIRAYGAPTVRLKDTDCEVHHASHGLNYHQGGADSVSTRLKGWDMDKMTVNDPAGGNDTGGMFISTYKTNGLITIIDAQSDRSYSIVRGTTPASYDYNWDGAGCIELYESGPVTIIRGVFRGSPVMIETGKGSTGANCGFLHVDGAKFWGQWPLPVVATTDAAGRTFRHTNIGILFRSMVGALIENSEFHDLDDHNFLLERAGNYATGAVLDNITSRNNKFWLKPGSNRYLTIGANVPVTPTTFNSFDDRIYTVAGSTVASVTGKGVSSDLATIRSWAPAGATYLGGNSYIGPEVVVPPPPTETPLQAAIRERDAALASLVTSQASLSVALANDAADLAKLVSMTAQRDAAVTGWGSTEAARVIAEAGRVASVTDAAKVRAAADVAAAV